MTAFGVFALLLLMLFMRLRKKNGPSAEASDLPEPTPQSEPVPGDVRTALNDVPLRDPSAAERSSEDADAIKEADAAASPQDPPVQE